MKVRNGVPARAKRTYNTILTETAKAAAVPTSPQPQEILNKRTTDKKAIDGLISRM